MKISNKDSSVALVKACDAEAEEHSAAVSGVLFIPKNR